MLLFDGANYALVDNVDNTYYVDKEGILFNLFLVCWRSWIIKVSKI